MNCHFCAARNIDTPATVILQTLFRNDYPVCAKHYAMVTPAWGLAEVREIDTTTCNSETSLPASIASVEGQLPLLK